jgi:TonB family protein
VHLVKRIAQSLLAALLLSSIVVCAQVANSSAANQGVSKTANGIFQVRDGISAPRTIYTPEPEYTKRARRAKQQGLVVLWLVVGADGLPHDVRVARSLAPDLDKQAVAAIQRWRFKPALKNGEPVAVQINIEVNFKLQ